MKIYVESLLSPFILCNGFVFTINWMESGVNFVGGVESAHIILKTNVHLCNKFTLNIIQM